MDKNELCALNTIENIGLDFLNKDGEKLEREDQLKTQYQTKMALDKGTNIDYFIIEKNNIDKVDRIDMQSKNFHFEEGVDHTQLSMCQKLNLPSIRKPEVEENQIRQEKLKINKICNLMNRRAKNLLKK